MCKKKPIQEQFQSLKQAFPGILAKELAAKVNGNLIQRTAVFAYNQPISAFDKDRYFKVVLQHG